MVAYVRTVKTASGATAVQIVWSSRRGSRQIEHLGSAHDEAQLEALKAAAAQRLAAGQQSLDLDLEQAGAATAPRWRSWRRDRRTCGRRCAAPTGCWGSMPPPAAMRCFAIWWSPGSSSRRARSMRCGCFRRDRSGVGGLPDAQAAPAGLRQT